MAEPLLQNNEGVHHMKSGLGKWADPFESWDRLHKEQDQGITPVFFGSLEIAPAGGLLEIGVKKALWYNSRYFSSFLLVVFVFYNVYFNFTTDTAAIMKEGGDYKEYLLSVKLIEHFGFHVENPQKVVSALEMIGLTVLVGRAMIHVFHATCAKGYKKWAAVACLSWRELPNISAFSAIKVLQYVTPQQISYDLNFLLWYEPAATQKVKLLIFFIFTPSMLVLGLDCFLIKVRLANHFLTSTEGSYDDVVGSIILLNQILGVAQLGKTIKRRLYRFIFAGEDGMMTTEELNKQGVWEAMISEKIWNSYPPAKALALLLSWCDDDFQMCVLNDKPVV